MSYRRNAGANLINKINSHHPSAGWLELMLTWWWQIRLQSRESKIRTLDPEVPWSMAQTSLIGSADILLGLRWKWMKPIVNTTQETLERSRTLTKLNWDELLSFNCKLRHWNIINKLNGQLLRRGRSYHKSEAPKSKDASWCLRATPLSFCEIKSWSWWI